MILCLLIVVESLHDALLPGELRVSAAAQLAEARGSLGGARKEGE